MSRLDNLPPNEPRKLPAPSAGPGGAVAVASASLFEIAWRRRWVIAAVTVAALAAAFLYVMKATPIFTSTSRLYVEQVGPQIMNEREGVVTQSKNYLYTQAEILGSTPILTEVTANPAVRKMKTFADVDNTMVFLKKSLDVKVGAKDDIISVGLDSPYPEEAAGVVNTVVEAYTNYHANRKKSTSSEVLKILQNEKSKRDTELGVTNKKILDFKTANPALTIEDERGGNVMIQALTKLSAALAEARVATINAKASFEAAKLLTGDPDKLQRFAEAQLERGYRISMEQEKTQLTGELHDLELQLADWQQKATPDHPAVLGLQAKIAQLKAKLDEQGRKTAEDFLEVARQQWLIAQQAETEMDTAFNQQLTQAQQVNTKAAELAILTSEKERTEKLLDILDSRIKELNVTEDTGALNISVLEVARPEEKPSKPQKTRIMAMALVLGLMVGFGLAMLLDWMDHRLRSADEISAVLGAPVLGIVPTMSSRESRIERGQKAHRESSSSIAESYRTIRTAIYFGVPDGGARTILITSPAPGDGKSTAASNLAITMAQAGQRTLLIDADFRKPVVHEIFEIDDQRGLSTTLTGQLADGLAVQASQVPGLDLLPCGPVPPNPSELLNSEAFAALLRKLAAEYDRVVIDSPPVMPVTDARILGALCDVTVLVLRAERSTRKASEQARDGLLSVGARLLGVLVNDVPRGRDRYGYYGGYGYYGQYGHYGRHGKNGREGAKDSGPAREKPALEGTRQS